MGWKIFRVSGRSMYPTVDDGDYILAKNYRTKPVNGSIAVIQHPKLGTLIKRINTTEEARTFIASGDNNYSAGNSSVGLFDENEIQYQAIWRVSPAGVSKLKLIDEPTV